MKKRRPYLSQTLSLCSFLSWLCMFFFVLNANTENSISSWPTIKVKKSKGAWFNKDKRGLQKRYQRAWNQGEDAYKKFWHSLSDQEKQKVRTFIKKQHPKEMIASYNPDFHEPKKTPPQQQRVTSQKEPQKQLQHEKPEDVRREDPVCQKWRDGDKRQFIKDNKNDKAIYKEGLTKFEYMRQKCN